MAYFFSRSNFSPNKSKQAEARKASLSMAVDDLRVAIQKENIATVQKYLDDGKVHSSILKKINVKPHKIMLKTDAILF